MDGLSSFTTVGDDLRISDNLALTDIDGLSSLTSVGADLSIDTNAALCQDRADAIIAACEVGGEVNSYGNFGPCPY